MSSHGNPSRPPVARRADLLWRRTASQVLVLQPGSRRLVVLDGTAVELWDLLSSPRDIDDVVSVLATRHARMPAAVVGDVHDALDDLALRGLVEAFP